MGRPRGPFARYCPTGERTRGLTARERLADRIEAVDGPERSRSPIDVIRGRFARLLGPENAPRLIVEELLPAPIAVRVRGNLNRAEQVPRSCGDGWRPGYHHGPEICGHDDNRGDHSAQGQHAATNDQGETAFLCPLRLRSWSSRCGLADSNRGGWTIAAL